MRESLLDLMRPTMHNSAGSTELRKVGRGAGRSAVYARLPIVGLEDVEAVRGSLTGTRCTRLRMAA